MKVTLGSIETARRAEQENFLLCFLLLLKTCYNRRTGILLHRRELFLPDAVSERLGIIFMKKFFWILLMAGTVFLIWHNSMEDQVHSDRASFFFVNMVQPLLTEAGRSIPPALLNHIIRKTAHVFEYTVLGTVLYTGLAYLCRKNRFLFLPAAAAGLLTAAVDEGIQIFSPGRGPQLSDVAIDFCGVLLGCLLGYCWRQCRRHCRAAGQQRDEFHGREKNFSNEGIHSNH